MMHFTCPCCGNKILEEKPPGTYEICSICFWEDDGVQFDDPDYEGGANAISLKQAQKNYTLFGVCEERFIDFSRRETIMLRDIWQKDNDYGKLEPLTDEMVALAESKLNIKLPNYYIELLKQQNGGYIKYNGHPSHVPTSWADDHVQVDHLFGIGSEKGILESEYFIQEWDLPNNIVLISGDGHSWIALDYRNSKTEPPVIYIDVELGQQITLAENFDMFINGLEEYNEEVVDSSYDTVLSEQEINDYFIQIDDVLRVGSPKEIDRLFTKVLSTNNELIRYMVEKLRHHEKPKVHYNLLLFLMCCAEGENKGILEDDYLLETLLDLSKSKNKDVRELALFSLEKLQDRYND